MSRPPEDRGYFVNPGDPDTPMHCKVGLADGLTPITREQARALSAAKRRGRAGETRVPVAPLSGDLADVVRAVAALQERVSALAAQPGAQVEIPDLKPLAEAVLALGRRVETVERDLSGVPVVVAELFQQARAEEERGT